MIKTIYVDMDGVLCDFLKRFYELYGVKPERDYPSKNAAKEEYRSRFKELVEDGNFETLDPMPDFGLAMEFLCSIETKYEIKLLTSSAKPKYLDEISKQKRVWLIKHGIHWPVIVVPGKVLKQQYATPTSLLIDDTEISIIQWRLKGGHAIHHKTWVETIAEFKDYI